MDNRACFFRDYFVVSCFVTRCEIRIYKLSCYENILMNICNRQSEHVEVEFPNGIDVFMNRIKLCDYDSTLN